MWFKNLRHNGQTPFGATAVILLVGGLLRMDLARSQIDNALWRVEQPRIGVPLLGRRSQAAIGTSKPLDRRNRVCAADLLPHCRLVRFARCLSTDLPSEIVGKNGVVGAPTLAVPPEPFRPRCAVPQLFGMLFGEKQREGVISEGRRGPPVIDLDLIQRVPRPLVVFLEQLSPIVAKHLGKGRRGGGMTKVAVHRLAVLVELVGKLLVAICSFAEERPQQLDWRVGAGRVIGPLLTKVLDAVRMDSQVFLAIAPKLTGRHAPRTLAAPVAAGKQRRRPVADTVQRLLIDPFPGAQLLPRFGLALRFALRVLRYLYAGQCALEVLKRIGGRRLVDGVNSGLEWLALLMPRARQPHDLR